MSPEKAKTFALVLALTFCLTAAFPALAGEWTTKKDPLDVSGVLTVDGDIIRVACKAKNPVMNFNIGTWSCKKTSEKDGKGVYNCARKESDEEITTRFCGGRVLQLELTGQEAQDVNFLAPRLCLCNDYN
ncbi:MAG: hypothetical protein KQJ78_18950 [Deltaproteobacteria bacterium]|nr:hypothetical protein [Deltaproteobacteria bacterium]